MACILSACYVLLTFHFAFGWSLDTSYRSPWSERAGSRPYGQGYGQNVGEPPRPIVENYPREDTDYTDYERNGNPRLEEQRRGESQQPVLPKTTSTIKTPYAVVPEWPTKNAAFGQISAVSFDQEGNVVIFHRADHTWNSDSFLPNEVYNQKDLGPIGVNTLITFDAESGKILHEWGANIFFMPHGLTIDKQSNVWVTDVALHQIFKFPPQGGSGQPILSLGTRFEPGNDDSHFCKPSGVAVTSGGDFFVSDGYCNHRIIKFSAKGDKLLEWGRSMLSFGPGSRSPPPFAFAVPHALALAEDKGTLCVADRENGRIQCFSIQNGTFISQIKLPEFGTRLFSVAYSPIQGGLLYAVNGPDMMGVPVLGFVIGLTSQQLVGEFTPNSEGFSNPHDVAVSPDGKQIYVVQLDPHRIWKFVESDSLLQFPDNKLKIIESTSPASAQSTPLPTTAIAFNALAKGALQSQQHSLVPNIETTPHLLSLGMQIFIAAAAIVALTMVAVVFVFVRRRGPWSSCWMCYKRWQFRRAPSDGFKLGSLLDPHSGFEQVCTEMSDEEEIDVGASTSGRSRNTTAEPLVPRA